MHRDVVDLHPAVRACRIFSKQHYAVNPRNGIGDNRVDIRGLSRLTTREIPGIVGCKLTLIRDVEGPIVTLTKGGRSRSLVLDASPETEAIVEAVRGTLTGNAQTLKAHFKVAVSGSTDQWALELQPIEPRLQVMLASVRIAGRRAEVRTVEMRMADGDRSVMSIEPLSADKKP